MGNTWENNEISWDVFCQRVSQIKITTETVDEYRKITKTQQDQIKNVGDFVAGHLTEEKRKSGMVFSRFMLTLDMDHGIFGIVDELERLFVFQCCIYSTHKYIPKEPRLRPVIVWKVKDEVWKFIGM